MITPNRTSNSESSREGVAVCHHDVMFVIALLYIQYNLIHYEYVKKSRFIHLDYETVITPIREYCSFQAHRTYLFSIMRPFT